MLPFLYLFGNDNAIIGQKEKIHATAGSRRRHYGRKVCSQGETEQKGQEGAGSAETGYLGVQPGDEESREQKIVFPQTKNPGSGDILSRLNLCAHPGCHLGCHVADAETFPVTCQNDRFFRVRNTSAPASSSDFRVFFFSGISVEEVIKPASIRTVPPAETNTKVSAFPAFSQ